MPLMDALSKERMSYKESQLMCHDFVKMHFFSCIILVKTKL